MVKYFVSYKFDEYDHVGNTIIRLPDKIEGENDIKKIEEKLREKEGEYCTLLFYTKM